jgi:hypothetical protein
MTGEKQQATSNKQPGLRPSVDAGKSASARRLLERVEAAWQPLREAAEALGLDRWEEITPAGWSAQEMLAHVAFWEEAVFGWVTIGIRGQALPKGWSFGSGYSPEAEWPSANVHNAREAEWARSRTAAEVMARWDRAHEQLLAILSTVTDREAAEQAAYFDEVGNHFREHLGELEALLDGSEVRELNSGGRAQ